MNRIAGYSSLDKTPSDPNKALSYMETLFSSLTPDRLIPRDYQYMVRILIKKNTGAAELANEVATLRSEISRDRARVATVPAAEREAINASIASKTAKADSLDAVILAINKDIDRALGFYNDYMKQNGNNMDRALLQEITLAYNSIRNYASVAKTQSMSLGPLPESRDAFMIVGRTYYNGGRYQSADSIFNVVITALPNYVPAYLWVARTSSSANSDDLELVKPKFDKLVEVAQRDSVANVAELSEGLTFLSSYYLTTNNYAQARAYFNRLAEVNPNSNENKIRAYNGIGLIEQRLASNEKTNEGRLPFIARSREAYNRILAIDPNNTSARNQLAYLQQFEASVKSGINPNEIKGTIIDAATNAPIAFVSIRVKDTAAEGLTNQKGEYKFEIPGGAEALIISATGYTRIEIPITSSRTYNASLSK